MKEFDELLNEVLFEKSNREPPLGMERRIASALSSDREPAFTKRTIWREVLAAIILLGLAGFWMLSRSQRIVSVASETGSVVAPEYAAGNTTSLPSSCQNSHGGALGRPFISERRPRRPLQRKALQLAPLEIEPLAIKPIEIALLTSSTSTVKGEVR